MSKRNSIAQKNTLFNYFSSPKSKPSNEETKAKTPIVEDVKPKIENNSEDEDSPIQRVNKKRLAIESESEEENDNKTPKKSSKQFKRLRVMSDERDNGEEEQVKSSPNVTDKLKQFVFKKGDVPSSPLIANKIGVEKTNNEESANEKSKKQKTVSSNGVNTPSTSKAKNIKQEVIGNQPTKKPFITSDTNWFHNYLDFLQPENIRDINKKRPDEPDYDSRTLYVPEKFLNEQTPAMRQWWIIKSDHYDCVIFFKLGKFYELYHMDAVVGATELGFSYMKGEFAHTGFPEIAYHNMVSGLIEKGYKVARTEQTETPDMMTERCKKLVKCSKYDKVVNREVCQISTKGSFFGNAQLSETPQSLNNFMFGISEKSINPQTIRFGVCFIDSTIGLFKLCEFDDDKHCSRLLAVFAENPPQLVLVERTHGKSIINKILNLYYSNIRKECLTSESQFYSAPSTIKKLKSDGYFFDENKKLVLPQFIQNLVDDIDSVKPQYELAVRSLGACIWYLKYSQLDIQVVSMGKFEFYSPPDLSKREINNSISNMILDSFTINNLKLLQGEDCLYRTIDFCQTAFGKRLLQQWICRPSCNISEITQRQDAIKELYNNPSLLKNVQDILKKLPDLERQVAKIHSYGNKLFATTHPDSRASFYEAATYSKRRIGDLLKTLGGFERSQEISSLFKDCESILLKKLTQFPSNGIYVDLTEVLQFFKNAFNQEEAEKNGTIIPTAGVSEDYDEAQNAIAEINNDLNDYLSELKKIFCKDVTYFGSDKKRYQIEIPDKYTHKVTDDYRLESSRKGAKPCKRYSTPHSRDLLVQMMKAEEQRTKVIKDLNRCIFENFSKKYEKWQQTIYCLSILDVLSSLAEYGRTSSHDLCFPEIKPFNDTNEIVIDNGRHPSLLNIINFVPNDIKMGIEDYPNVFLLTGPNMGGKSTLMRQVALIAIMAQIGSYVPATYCRLNLIDRIFTRLGAYDDIIKGQSTFLVELSEASSILKHVTQCSLILLDELGRGTSTHDGNAIAAGYVQKLTEIKCRTLFSTHYHSLVDNFINNANIQLGYMACLVENEDDPVKETITYLYKLAKGRCPKSYGFNVAHLARLKSSIISRSREVAKQLEAENQNRHLFTELFASNDITFIRKMLCSE